MTREEKLESVLPAIREPYIVFSSIATLLEGRA